MNTNVTRRLVQVFLTLFIQGVILFVAAGTLFWKWAWILLLLSVVILIINLLVIPVELIEERGRLQKDAKKWDKVLTSINIIPTILLYVCSGLDYRFNLTGNVNILINSFRPRLDCKPNVNTLLLPEGHIGLFAILDMLVTLLCLLQHQ